MFSSFSCYLEFQLINNTKEEVDNKKLYFNSIIREWKRNSYKKNKNTKCKSFSIYQNDKLIKTNIPINYREVDLENINIIQDVLLTLKCDKFIKYLKVKREVTSNGNENSESESGTVSVEESEDEVDPIFNIIDNEFDQINKNEDKEDNIDNSFIPVHPNNTNTNKNDKSKESTTNNNDNNNNNSKQTTIENKPSIHAISGKNNQSEKNKTPVKTTKNDKNKTSDKINNKNDKTSANNNNKANNSLSSTFLLTGGMFLSVLKFRKMSNLQLEINAQEMTTNSIYVPSPRLCQSSSISSMELRSFSSSMLQEDTMQSSTISSTIV
ncbi:hypothetical protein H8356DRAFT_1024176 [Neocallimastix lanati (nom. inval.)]|nr:hypothetical protein H8356DRAFT_1024176 [Neocallimastix sp. JGI-2020a]